MVHGAASHGRSLYAWRTPAAAAQFLLDIPRRSGDPLAHCPLSLVPNDIREGVT
jgi:hypothetical protein